MSVARIDTVAAAAVDAARAAAEQVAGGDVGEHLGAVAEDERVVAHRFAATHPGYRGWEWTVVLARVPRARSATVSEVVLLPGDRALLAPAWVPWSDRIAPGDLGEADVLPYRADDPLLEESFEQTGGAAVAGGDDALDDLDLPVRQELGLGRPRVLGREGRAEAAARWYRGASGPDTTSARAAAAPCASCGYLVRLAGSLRGLFGVCANAWSPDDGRVVSLDHGCGAHSETGVTAEDAAGLPQPLLDQLREDLDVVPLPDEPPAQGSSDGAVDATGAPPGDTAGEPEADPADPGGTADSVETADSSAPRGAEAPSDPADRR
ncbi:MAG: DUF3027 domain-containing protein [Kineosporiaceae bacterium]